MLERGRTRVSSLPADDQFAELRAPVADVVVRNYAMAQQPKYTRQAIAKDRRANVAHMHRLGHVRRTEVDDQGARRSTFREKKVFTSGGALQHATDRFELEPKIQKARAGDLHFLAPLRNIEVRQHIGSELSRVYFPLFGEGHQRVGLVIAELWIGTGADQQDGVFRVRQN